MIYLGDSTKDPSKLFKHNSIDAIICDPPYGIFGDTLDKHYNRNEDNVLSGYIDVKPEEYAEFSNKWIEQASIILKTNGILVIVSGWSNLYDIMAALKNVNFKIIRHIIWKYNFGVYTKHKFISSHYHILIACKSSINISLPLNKLETVWKIPREYHTGEIKNKNQLPTSLLQMLISYVSKPKDTIIDLFMGGFSTLRVAKLMDRNIGGIEMNKKAFVYGRKSLMKDIDLKPLIIIRKAISYKNTNLNESNLLKYPSNKVKTAIYYFNNPVPSQFLENLQNKLHDNASIFIVIPTTFLLSALKIVKESSNKFTVINHIIWNHSPYRSKYGKETHSHIIFLQYGSDHSFYREVFYKDSDREDGLSMNYKDREDVWDIKLSKKKSMPKELIDKMIKYTTLNAKDAFVNY